MTMKVLLLVEDNAGDARLIREMLRDVGDTGTDVTHVGTMREAELHLAAHAVDIVLLDLGLPDADGLTAVRRAVVAAPQVPVVVLTGLDDQRTALEALQEGAQDYLVKGDLDARGMLRSLRYAVERKTMHETLSDERERARVTLDSIADAVICTDVAGRVTLHNRAAERLTGWPSVDIIGREVADVVRVLDIDTGSVIADLMDTTADDAPLDGRTDCMLVRRDGSEVPMDRSSSPIRDRRGRAIGSVVVFRDVTQTRALALEAKRAKEELERSNRELQDFASVASHDLREPLRKVRAFGDRLFRREGDRLGEESRDDLDRIQAAAQRMLTLIDDLLDFARIASRERPFERVDLQLIAAEVLEDLATTIEQTGGRVTVDPLPTIDADPLQMRQLFQNLIGNGLKFHRDGTPPIVHLTVAPGTTHGGAITTTVLEVTDNGIGFEPRHADRIFVPFERLHGRSAYAGTGIGLAICAKIVVRHGGTVVATSQPGVGSSFVVTLPLRQGAPPARRAAA
jgi:PAS domain S-box-containing protein